MSQKKSKVGDHKEAAEISTHDVTNIGEFWLEAVTMNATTDPRMVTLETYGNEVTFTIYTGVNVTVIRKHVPDRVTNTPALRLCQSPLQSLEGKIPTIGEFDGQTTWR